MTAAVVTYRREAVLVETLERLAALDPPPDEILVVDQTAEHRPETVAALESGVAAGRVRWLRTAVPSVTRSMNLALLEAGHPIVLFVDDDVAPDPGLVEAHRRAHGPDGARVVVGQVLQPGESPLPPDVDPAPDRFAATRRGWVREVIGCNFSVDRGFAIDVGGFDENFVRVAYRYEAEFADRVRAAGERILFEPRAALRHLKAERGGTRAWGHHLRTARPGHAVGAYYHVLRSPERGGRLRRVARRAWRSIRTRHHARRPWWIPLTLIGELGGLAWAVGLAARGPRLLAGGAARPSFTEPAREKDPTNREREP